MADVFREIAFDHAEELLEALAPERGGELWNRLDHGGWLFRGQRDAEWDLTPSAHRADTLQRFTVMKENPCPLTLDDSLKCELRAVVEFANLADAGGFELPGDGVELREQRLPTQDGTNFPPLPFLGIFALAQHYHVPTRLLDWTQDPLIAAYFACAEAAMRAVGLSKDIPPKREAGNHSGRIAVWALARSDLKRLARDPSARVVTVPTTSNPNLRAQRAVFTLVAFAINTPAWPVPALDALIKAAPREAWRPPPVLPVLFKLTLPCLKTPELLYLLRLRGVTAATVFPGLHSIARAICESRTRTPT